jgi:DNA-binding IscR family transcriptional regulator
MLHMSANANFTMAIHILAFLAEESEPASSAYIASSLNAHPVTVRRMISHLRAGGLVDTVAGSLGGAQLIKPPSDITLGDVYQLVREGHLFGLHPQPPSPACPVGRNLSKVLTRIFDDLDGLLLMALMKITIFDIVVEINTMQAVAQ